MKAEDPRIKQAIIDVILENIPKEGAVGKWTHYAHDNHGGWKSLQIFMLNQKGQALMLKDRSRKEMGLMDLSEIDLLNLKNSMMPFSEFKKQNPEDNYSLGEENFLKGLPFILTPFVTTEVKADQFQYNDEITLKHSVPYKTPQGTTLLEKGEILKVYTVEGGMLQDDLFLYVDSDNNVVAIQDKLVDKKPSSDNNKYLAF